MEVHWSVLAAHDLERICAWIERDNPEAAQRIARTIYDGCGHLGEFPNIGRASRRISGRRELIFPPLPYIAVYQVKEISLKSRAYSTGAQDWP